MDLKFERKKTIVRACMHGNGAMTYMLHLSVM